MFSVVFIPPPPSNQPRHAMFGSSSLNLTLYRQCSLAYPYDWRGFVGAKKKMSVGLLVFSPLWYIHTLIFMAMRIAERSSINSNSAHSVKKHTQNLYKYTILKCCFHNILCTGKYTAVSNLNQREQIRLFDERIFYNTGNIRWDPSSSSSSVSSSSILSSS